jgi:cytochrome c-type biogenesis protein CcmF
MTFAHLGLGVFALGAAVEIAGNVEVAKIMAPGDVMTVGAYSLRLDGVTTVDGPNFTAERATLAVTRNGNLVCTGTPEKRVYSSGGNKAVSAICTLGASRVFIALGDDHTDAAGRTTWLLRGTFNPLYALIFLGPALMALGGFVSLSDRRLRLGVARKARRALEPDAAEKKTKVKPAPAGPSEEGAPA